MAVNIQNKIKSLNPAQREKVKVRAAELIAEEMTLRELRKARKLTQTRMAKVLHITQDGVCRLEKRSDLLISTLRRTIQAMGGDLSIVAKFPDRAPVVLSGITSEQPREIAKRFSRSIAGSQLRRQRTGLRTQVRA
jgi:transcriptional regulator with XRE-family HTH domain